MSAGVGAGGCVVGEAMVFEFLSDSETTSDLEAAYESWCDEPEAGACGENCELESMSKIGLLDTGCWIDSGEIGLILLMLAGDGRLSSKCDADL